MCNKKSRTLFNKTETGGRLDWGLVPVCRLLLRRGTASASPRPPQLHSTPEWTGHRRPGQGAGAHSTSLGQARLAPQGFPTLAPGPPAGPTRPGHSQPHQDLAPLISARLTDVLCFTRKRLRPVSNAACVGWKDSFPGPLNGSNQDVPGAGGQSSSRSHRGPPTRPARLLGSAPTSSRGPRRHRRFPVRGREEGPPSPTDASSGTWRPPSSAPGTPSSQSWETGGVGGGLM